MKDIDYYLDCYLNREHLKANNNKNSLRTLKSKLKKLKKYLAELCLEPGQLGVRQAQSFTAWLKEQKTSRVEATHRTRSAGLQVLPQAFMNI